MTAAIDRMPPMSVEAEQAVLGSCLMDPDAAAVASAILMPESFSRPGHRVLFGVIRGLVEDGQAVDFVTVTEALRQAGRYDEVGGLTFLSDLVNVVPTALHVEHYARLVAEAAARRRIIQAAVRITQAAYDESKPLDELQSMAWRELAGAGGAGELSQIQAPPDRADALARIVVDITERRTVGISTGIADLDRALHGLRGGQLVIVAARPSIGKTALMQGICRHVARRHGPVLLCSAEMSGDELVARDAAAVMRRQWREVEHELARGDICEMTSIQLERAGDELRALPLYVYHNPRMTTAHIRARGQEMRAKHGLSLLAVDYLQLLKDSDGSRDSENVRVARVSGNLKAIAGELGVPVLVASQLNRAVEHRAPPIPELADLRDTGAIEQDADVVLGLYRADRYYQPGADDHEGGRVQKGRARLEVLKQRGGPAPVVLPLVWIDSLCEYRSLAEDSQ